MTPVRNRPEPRLQFQQAIWVVLLLVLRLSEVARGLEKDLRERRLLLNDFD